MGTIRDIIWESGTDYSKDPSLALLVDFADYIQNVPLPSQRSTK